MTRTTTRTAASALALLLLAPAGGAAAQAVGDGFRCAGPEGRADVLATLGRTDRLSELAGAAPDTGGATAPADDPIVFHVQLTADAGDGADAPDPVAHAPFREDALASCTPEANTPFDEAAFADGLAIYREAVPEDGPALFEITPGEAFWLLRDAAMDGEVQR